MFSFVHIFVVLAGVASIGRESIDYEWACRWQRDTTLTTTLDLVSTNPLKPHLRAGPVIDGPVRAGRPDDPSNLSVISKQMNEIETFETCEAGETVTIANSLVELEDQAMKQFFHDPQSLIRGTALPLFRESAGNSLFSLSNPHQRIEYEKLFHRGGTAIVVQASCRICGYEVNLTGPKLRFTSYFLSDLMEVTGARFTLNSFFKQYGSHYVHSVELGSKYITIIKVPEANISFVKSAQKNFEHCVKRFPHWSKRLKGSWSWNEKKSDPTGCIKILSDSSPIKLETQNFDVGAKFDSHRERWICEDDLRFDNPEWFLVRPIKYDLRPITDLITPQVLQLMDFDEGITVSAIAPISDRLERGYKEYCYIELNSYIPTPCLEQLCYNQFSLPEHKICPDKPFLCLGRRTIPDINGYVVDCCRSTELTRIPAKTMKQAKRGYVSFDMGELIVGDTVVVTVSRFGGADLAVYLFHDMETAVAVAYRYEVGRFDGDIFCAIPHHQTIPAPYTKFVKDLGNNGKGGHDISTIRTYVHDLWQSNYTDTTKFKQKNHTIVYNPWRLWEWWTLDIELRTLSSSTYQIKFPYEKPCTIHNNETSRMPRYFTVNPGVMIEAVRKVDAQSCRSPTLLRQDAYDAELITEPMSTTEPTEPMAACSCRKIASLLCEFALLLCHWWFASVW